MKCIHIITPVKDSIELTLQTVDAIMASDVKTPFTYTVYNDFSTEENTARLREASGRLGFELVNLADVTSHPSPNYLLILQMSQERAIAEEAGLVIVESDVVVKKDTLQSLFDGALERKDCGIAAAVTVDDDAAEVDILCCAILYGFFCCFYRQITIYCIVFLLLFLRQLRNIRMGFAGNVENAVIAAPVLVPPGISMQTYRVNLIVVRIFLLYVIFKRGANITIGT